MSFVNDIHMPKTLYIDFSGPAYPLLERIVSATSSSALKTFVRRLSLDSASRRNPRSGEYMNLLAAERDAHPDDVWIHLEDTSTLPAMPLDGVERVVLLWRDGNGTGWRTVERHVFANKAPGARVDVLNGRRRAFELTPALWRGYLTRRFVEKSLVPDMAIAAMLLTLSPVIIGWDLIRGRH